MVLEANTSFRNLSVVGLAKDPKNDVNMIDQGSQETRDIVYKLFNPKRELRYVYDLRTNSC